MGCGDRVGMKEEALAELPEGGCRLILWCGREKGEFRFGQQGDVGNALWKGPEGDSAHLHGLGNVSMVRMGQAHGCSFRAGGQAPCSPWAGASPTPGAGGGVS